MKRLIALASLLLAITPAMACIDCIPDDGSIDTYFTGSGWNVYFNDALYLDDMGNPDFIIEDVYTMYGEVTVWQNIDIEDPAWYDWFGQTEVLLNKQLTVDPGSFFFHTFDANVEKEVYWDGGGAEVFREAYLGDVYHVVGAGADAGWFIDDIEYAGTVNVYEAVGLNMDAICEPPTIELPEPPFCDVC